MVQPFVLCFFSLVTSVSFLSHAHNTFNLITILQPAYYKSTLQKTYEKKENYNLFKGNFFNPVKEMPNNFYFTIPTNLKTMYVDLCTTQTKISDIQYREVCYITEQKEAFILFKSEFYLHETFPVLLIELKGKLVLIGKNPSFIKIEALF